MPFATLGDRRATGGTAVHRSREVLRREVGRRTTAILAELDAITARLAAGQTVTAAEVLHAAARIDALRVTIAYSAVLGTDA